MAQRILFNYDPLGRRISKQVYNGDASEPNNRTLFHWQGLRMLEEVQDGRPSLYVYADPGSYEPLARIDGKPGSEAIFYFHTNLAGLPEQLTDTNGNTVWHSEYLAWGKARDEWHDQQVGNEQNLRFQGQYLDRETGLHYNTFRFFDPEVGRFTQPDPIGLAGGLNLYQYSPNPIGWVDPWGWSGCSLQEYEVGKFDDLQRQSRIGDKLDVHHAVQKHPAGQVINGYDPKTGPSIALPRKEHKKIPTVKGQFTGTARDLLAKDIRDLRKYTNTPSSSIKELINLNKEMFPKAFERTTTK